MAEEDAIRRVMPHSIEAEQSVIGAMLMDAEAIERPFLRCTGTGSR